MITLTEKNKCTGCGACAQVCALGAISMKEDKEGFLFPHIDENVCVSCKKCVDSCPIEKTVKKIVPKGIYAARAQDEAIVEKSSSGGLFSVFAGKVLRENGVVFGAGYDEDFNLIHKSVAAEDSIKELAGSKYVQSDVKDTYKSVKSHLDSGKKFFLQELPANVQDFLRFSQKNTPICFWWTLSATECLPPVFSENICNKWEREAILNPSDSVTKPLIKKADFI